MRCNWAVGQHMSMAPQHGGSSNSCRLPSIAAFAHVELSLASDIIVRVFAEMRDVIRLRRVPCDKGAVKEVKTRAQ